MDATPTPDAAPDDVGRHAPAPLPPFSGLAISAFVLSFIAGFAAIAAYWQATLIPIALAVLAILLIAKTGKRGRILAYFAIGVSLAFGSCSYMLHTQGRDVWVKVPQGMLAILASDESAEAKDEKLTAWAWPAALEKSPELTKTWRASFDAMVDELGPWQGEVVVGSHAPGMFGPIVPPPHGDEIRPTTDAEPPAALDAIWVQVPFEKGTVWLCVVLGSEPGDGKDAASNIQEDGPGACAGGMRYFRLE